MRRLFCLGAMVSVGFLGACGGGGGGGAGGSGGAAGTPGHGGSGGAAGHATGGATGGAAGQAAGGAGGTAGVGGNATAGTAGNAAAGAGGNATAGAGGNATAGAGGNATAGAGGNAAAGAGGNATAGAGGNATAGAGGNATAGAGGNAAGGAGGSGVTCLDPTTFSASFTIADSTFCAIARYTAPESLGSAAPTWGSHGGPLVVQPAAAGAAGASGTGVTLERWTAPSGSTGAMTVQTTPVASAFPSGAFLGSQALDLPFFGWTAISYENAFPDTTGKFEMIVSGAIATSYDVNGAFSAVAVPAASSLGRLLFSGLSPLGMATTNATGLYEADACSSPSNGLGTGTGCSASALVATWDEYDGSVAADSNGDVFAVMTSATNGNQQARGFLASSVARGSAATAGVPLFTVPGYSGSLAALSPSGSAPGVVVFQPFDSTTGNALDVVQQKFTTGSALAATGTPTTLLTVPPGQLQGLSFLVDGSQRLWVAVSGTSSTTYVVLVRH